MEPKLSKGYSERGAYMGRRETAGDPDAALIFRVYRMSIDSGGYDNGGAYWGLGKPLYRAFASSDELVIAAEFYMRADSRESVTEEVLRRYPNARLAAPGPRTPVLFRVSNDDPSDVYALFPRIYEGRGMVRCFQHVGQHSTADLQACLASTRPATAAEARALRVELESAPYRYRLRPVQATVSNGFVHIV